MRWRSGQPIAERLPSETRDPGRRSSSLVLGNYIKEVTAHVQPHPTQGDKPTLSTLPLRFFGPSWLGRFEPFRWIADVFDWDPFREMSPRFGPSALAISPDFEVAETKDSYAFTGDLPGLSESDIAKSAESQPRKIALSAGEAKGGKSARA